MAMILRNAKPRLAFQFGRQSGIRSSSGVVDQLQDQLQAEREKHAKEIAVLANKLTEVSLELRDLGAVYHEVVQQNLLAALAAAPSPSAMLH